MILRKQFLGMTSRSNNREPLEVNVKILLEKKVGRTPFKPKPEEVVLNINGN